MAFYGVSILEATALIACQLVCVYVCVCVCVLSADPSPPGLLWAFPHC